jgi:hypothetical protein
MWAVDITRLIWRACDAAILYSFSSRLSQDYARTLALALG